MELIELAIQLPKLVVGAVGIILVIWMLKWLERIHNILVKICNILVDILDAINKNQ